MKKNLLKISTLMVLMVLAIGFKSFAQNLNSSKAPAALEFSSKAIILSESFDGATFPPASWDTINSSTGSWDRVTAGVYPVCSPHSGAGMARFNSYTAVAGQYAILVSPVVDLTGNAGMFDVSFWMYHEAGYNTVLDSIAVYVNTTASMTGATFLGTAVRPVGTGWLLHSFNIPGSFNTATNYFFFKGISQYGNDCHMDDISVNSPSVNDVGVTAIIAPITPIVPGAYVPQITVKNFGTAAQTDIPVYYKIGTAGTVIDTTIASLASGASVNISFPSWTAANGSYNFIFYTGLVGDAATPNDTMKRTVNVTDLTWTAGANATLSAYLGSGAISGGKLYCMGGNQPDAAGTTVAIYDIAGDSWAAGPALPAARVIGAAAGTSTKVYFIGGSDGTNYLNTVWELTPPGVTWAVKATLPINIGWAKTAVYQDSLIYLLGGNDGTNPLATVYLYNTNTNTWRICTSMPGAAFGGVAAITGNTLVWTSGADNSAALTVTYKGVIDAVNHATIVWSTGTAIPTASFKADGGTWGPSEIIVATGTNGSGGWWTPTAPNPCYAYNPTTNTWRTLTPKTTPTLGGFTATLLFSSTSNSQTWKIISASGYDGVAATNKTEILIETWSDAGITTNSDAKFSIYPNPVSDVLNIASDKLINNVKIYNVSGQLIYNNVVKDIKTEINISSFSNGIYLLQIESTDGISVEKFNVAK